MCLQTHRGDSWGECKEPMAAVSPPGGLSEGSHPVEGRAFLEASKHCGLLEDGVLQIKKQKLSEKCFYSHYIGLEHAFSSGSILLGMA